MEDGYAAFDMQPFMTAMREGTAPDEVSLAKIEQCIADGSMPLKLSLIHISEPTRR